MKRVVHSLTALIVVGVAIAMSGCNLTAVPTQSVGGTISGLSGSVTLRINGADPLTLSADGRFTFSTPLPQGTTYAVAVLTQPVGGSCAVNQGSGLVNTANITTVAVVCSASPRTIGGTVSGLNGTVTLTNNGADPKTISSNGAFTFATPLAQGTNYAVAIHAQPANQTCAVTNGIGPVGDADVTSVAVVCVTGAFTVGGAVSGLTGTVVLKDNGGDTRTISSDGVFTFATPVLEGQPYAVTVQTQPTGETCSVGHGTGPMGAANITTVSVVCSANSFTVGGTVAGLSGTVVIQNNSADTRTVSSNGTFTFATAVAYGASYAVTVLTQPATQTCSVANSSGPMGAANITNVTVVCSVNAYTVGGTVSGLSGSVVLQDNGSDAQTLSANGSFTFATPVAQGSNYSVTVLTQPTAQFCTVANSSGPMGGANVTNATVTCVANTTTISVSATATIPVGAGSGSITVTNTGSTFTAHNVAASLPGGWTGVTQDASACTAIAPLGSCTLLFTSTTPYVAQGSISVSGDNLTSSVPTALAFSLAGYLVSGVPTGSVATVVANSDATSSIAWSPDFFAIPGITETSTTAGGAACNGATDGACDSTQIVAHYSTPYTNYAAGLCYQITSDGTGTVSLGTWHLPAICEMGTAGGGANCPTGLANWYDNLVQAGFTDNLNADGYWSSTEVGFNPSQGVWAQGIEPGQSNQIPFSKHVVPPIGVRCTRSIGY
jgi:hypothetical protein